MLDSGEQRWRRDEQVQDEELGALRRILDVFHDISERESRDSDIACSGTSSSAGSGPERLATAAAVVRR